MKRKLVLSVVFFLATFTPLVNYAALCPSSIGTPRYFTDILCLFTDLITTAIPIVAGIALLVFFWGLAKFILKAGEEDARDEGRQVMKWGIIALFVMVSIWGIVSLLQTDLFGVATQSVPQLPINRP